MTASNRNHFRIPVIDISNAGQSTGDDMVDAAARYGFLYIRASGTGFAPEIVDGMFEIVSIYFYMHCSIVRILGSCPAAGPSILPLAV